MEKTMKKVFDSQDYYHVEINMRLNAIKEKADDLMAILCEAEDEMRTICREAINENEVGSAVRASHCIGEYDAMCRLVTNIAKIENIY